MCEQFLWRLVKVLTGMVEKVKPIDTPRHKAFPWTMDIRPFHGHKAFPWKMIISLLLYLLNLSSD
uniref:Uncharacterized protein n=1 Tax=Romanomermis culicivorax TaxID=13658 RepID=A0A915K089_ROMCU